VPDLRRGGQPGNSFEKRLTKGPSRGGRVGKKVTAPEPRIREGGVGEKNKIGHVGSFQRQFRAKKEISCQPTYAENMRGSRFFRLVHEKEQEKRGGGLGLEAASIVRDTPLGSGAQTTFAMVQDFGGPSSPLEVEREGGESLSPSRSNWCC